MTNHEKRSEIARRDFLRVAGATSAALGVAGVTGQAVAADPPRDGQGKVIPGFDDTGKLLKGDAGAVVTCAHLTPIVLAG